MVPVSVVVFAVVINRRLYFRSASRGFSCLVYDTPIGLENNETATS